MAKLKSMKFNSVCGNWVRTKGRYFLCGNGMNELFKNLSNDYPFIHVSLHDCTGKNRIPISLESAKDGVYRDGDGPLVIDGVTTPLIDAGIMHLIRRVMKKSGKQKLWVQVKGPA